MSEGKQIGSISLEKKVEHKALWLVITKSYFKNNNFKNYTEKKINLEQKVNPTRKFIL